MQPYLSVIIPAYNEEKILPRCLKALQNQTYPKDNYEIIVVDNDSQDETMAIAKEHGVRVLHYTDKHIVAAVRNYGVAHAHGAVFVFVDADSVVTPDYLEKVIFELENTKYVAVAGEALPLDNKPYIKIMFRLYHYILLINQLFGVVIPWGFSLAIRKPAFIALGGFDENLSTYDDATMGLRIQKKFGKRSIFYTGRLQVFTSARKHQRMQDFVPYVIDTIKNYTNFVILKRTQAAEIRNVR
jgi:glycosyltransferase involved in cell wall biosynthesis